MDRNFYIMFYMADMTEEGLKSWMDEWVYGCKDRSYFNHYIAKFGYHMLNAIKQSYYSAPAITVQHIRPPGIMKVKPGYGSDA